MNLYAYARTTEQSGIRLYRELASRAHDEGVGRIFNMLAEDEQRLLEKLELMKQRFPELADVECADLQEQDNPFERLRSLSGSQHIATDLEAYQLGKTLEHELIDHYNKIAAHETERTARMLTWIASLERQELAEIEKLYDFANAPNESLEWGEFSNLDEFHNFGRYEDLRQGDLGDPVIPDTIVH
jgi:rubrerythrin